MKKNLKTINVFEIISRINNEFGNHVYSARSFPSIDVRLGMNGNGKRKVSIETYESDEPECSTGHLEIEWDTKSTSPVYHIKSYCKQEYKDDEPYIWDKMDFETTDLTTVISNILGTVIVEDDSFHDVEPEEYWPQTKMFPDDYFEYCVANHKGIFEGIGKSTRLETPWY